MGLLAFPSSTLSCRCPVGTTAILQVATAFSKGRPGLPGYNENSLWLNFLETRLSMENQIPTHLDSQWGWGLPALPGDDSDPFTIGEDGAGSLCCHLFAPSPQPFPVALDNSRWAGGPCMTAQECAPRHQCTSPGCCVVTRGRCRREHMTSLLTAAENVPPCLAHGKHGQHILSFIKFLMMPILSQR